MSIGKIDCHDMDLVELRQRARVRISAHALSRMTSLRVCEQEVLNTVLHPKLVLPNALGHPRDRSILSNGVVRVVMTHVSRVITTVELDTSMPYVHGVDTRPTPHRGFGLAA